MHLHLPCDKSAFTTSITANPPSSNPATSLHWTVEQEGVEEQVEGETRVEEVGAGTSVSSSSVTVAMGASDLVVTCLASQRGSRDIPAYTHMVALLSELQHTSSTTPFNV